MSSTILDPIAETISGFISDLTLTDGTAVHGEKWEPGTAGIDSLPAGIVGIPSIDRTSPGDVEPQLGSDAWTMEYEVVLCVDLAEAKFAQAQAVELVELFIDSVDDDPSLGDPQVVSDAVVERAEPEVVADERRPMLTYRCRLLVEKLVSRP